MKVSFDIGIFRIINKNINFIRMEIHVNKCIMHEDNYLIAVSYLHDDQTDGNLLKDQTEDTLILKFIYGNI